MRVQGRRCRDFAITLSTVAAPHSLQVLLYGALPSAAAVACLPHVLDPHMRSQGVCVGGVLGVSLQTGLSAHDLAAQMRRA